MFWSNFKHLCPQNTVNSKGRDEWIRTKWRKIKERCHLGYKACPIQMLLTSRKKSVDFRSKEQNKKKGEGGLGILMQRCLWGVSLMGWSWRDDDDDDNDARVAMKWEVKPSWCSDAPKKKKEKRKEGSLLSWHSNKIKKREGITVRELKKRRRALITSRWYDQSKI